MTYSLIAPCIKVCLCFGVWSQLSPDDIGLAIKQWAVVSHPGCVSEVVLASYEVEDARCPVSYQPCILHHTRVKYE